MILPVLLLRNSTRRASVSLCRFTRSMPTPTSAHCARPSLSLPIRNTLLRISCTVSSPSSPSPSWSCAEPAPSSAGAGGWPSPGAGVLSSDESFASPSPLPLPSSPAGTTGAARAAGFAPNENGSALSGGASSPGVFGGLPNPNPTGLPMLPDAALGGPNENPLAAAVEEGVEENEKGEGADAGALGSLSSGVVVLVPEPLLAPKGVDVPEPKPKIEGAAGLSLSASASLSLSVSLDASADLPNTDPPKNEGVVVEDAPNREGVELEELPKIDVEDELGGAKREGVDVDIEPDAPGLENRDPVEGGAPNKDEGAAVVEGAEEPKEKAAFGASLVTELELDSDFSVFVPPKLKGLPSIDVLLVSILGTNPPDVNEDVEGVEATARVFAPPNPPKLLGAAGMENVGFGVSLGFAVGSAGGVGDAVFTDLDLVSNSVFAVIRRAL